jgi:hypothetical protein
MIVEQKISYSGHYRLCVRKVIDNFLVKELEFDNIILNTGLNRIVSGNTIPSCYIGTGTSNPTFEDLSLQSFSAGTSTIQSNSITVNVSTLPYYQAYIRRYRFNAGQLNGNYSEIGVGWASTSGGLFSRALIKDGLGNPTTITILSDEFLDVFYELRGYIPDDNTVQINATGISPTFEITAHPILINRTGNNTVFPSSVYYLNTNDLPSGWSPPVGSGTIGNQVSPSVYAFYLGISNATSLYSSTASPGVLNFSPAVVDSYTSSTYITDSYYLDWTLVYGLNRINTTINGFLIGSTNAGVWQYLFNTPIVKSSSQTLTITIRTSWGRYTP